MTALALVAMNPPCSATAQAYFSDEYAQVQEVTSAGPAPGVFEVWITAPLTASGYRFRIPEDSDASPRWLFWTRGTVTPDGCSDARIRRSVVVCELLWPLGVDASHVLSALVTAEVVPIPDVTLLAPRSTRCSDDGWHLWIRHDSKAIESCLYDYTWPSERGRRYLEEYLADFINEHSPIFKNPGRDR